HACSRACGARRTRWGSQAPASDEIGLAQEAALGAQRPVAARPAERADDDRLGVRLVEMEPARLAQPPRPWLAKPGRDGDHGRVRLVADDLEVVPLAHR